MSISSHLLIKIRCLTWMLIKSTIYVLQPCFTVIFMWETREKIVILVLKELFQKLNITYFEVLRKLFLLYIVER